MSQSKSKKSKSKPNATAAGGARVPQNARLNFYVLLRAPLQCVKIKEIKFKKPNASWPTGATNLGAFNSRMYNVPRISRYVQDNEKLPPAHRTWRALRRYRTRWVPEAPEPASNSQNTIQIENYNDAVQIQKNETLKTSTIQLLQLSTEENKLLQLLYKSSAFVTDFFGEGEITEYRLLHSSSLYTRSSSLAALGW